MQDDGYDPKLRDIVIEHGFLICRGVRPTLVCPLSAIQAVYLVGSYRADTLYITVGGHDHEIDSAATSKGGRSLLNSWN
jgi:hypothetical protein